MLVQRFSGIILVTIGLCTIMKLVMLVTSLFQIEVAPLPNRNGFHTRFSGPNVWNSVPESILVAEHLGLFKNKLIEYF
jgi:hypothetical protein